MKTSIIACLLLVMLLVVSAKDYTRPVKIGSLINNEVEIIFAAQNLICKQSERKNR